MSHVEREIGLAFETQVTYTYPGQPRWELCTARSFLANRLISYRHGKQLELTLGIKPSGSGSDHKESVIESGVYILIFHLVMSGYKI